MDNLQIIEKSNLSSNELLSSGKICNKFTTTQNNRIPENKKPIGQYAHPEQKFDHSETNEIFRNRQIFRETNYPCLIFHDLVFKQHCHQKKNK